MGPGPAVAGVSACAYAYAGARVRESRRERGTETRGGGNPGPRQEVPGLWGRMEASPRPTLRGGGQGEGKRAEEGKAEGLPPFPGTRETPSRPRPPSSRGGRRRNGSERDRGRIPTRRPRGRALWRGRLPRGAGAVRPRPRWSRRHCPPGGRWPSGGGGPSPSSPRHPGSSGFRR